MGEPGAVDGAIEQIRAGFDLLATVDLTELTGTEVLELVQSTQRVRSMADAACVRAAGAMDVSHAWTGDGARVTQFEKALAYWKQLNEPDRVEDAAQAAFDRREAHASTTLDDIVVVDALLDPVGGAIFLRELERLEHELFEADWADARARLGDAACAEDLARTPRQRRAVSSPPASSSPT